MWGFCFACKRVYLLPTRNLCVICWPPWHEPQTHDAQNYEQCFDFQFNDSISDSKPIQTNENGNWMRGTQTKIYTIRSERTSAINSISLWSSPFDSQCCLLSIFFFIFSKSCSTFWKCSNEYNNCINSLHGDCCRDCHKFESLLVLRERYMNLTHCTATFQSNWQKPISRPVRFVQARVTFI